MPRNEGSGNPDLSQFSEFGACQQICAVWHGLQSHLCCLIQTGPLPPLKPEHIVGNDVAGLGKLRDSYCNSMKGFQRVGSRKSLKLQNCPTPPLGTTKALKHFTF
jgi:hypothetical protein